MASSMSPTTRLSVVPGSDSVRNGTGRCGRSRRAASAQRQVCGAPPCRYSRRPPVLSRPSAEFRRVHGCVTIYPAGDAYLDSSEFGAVARNTSGTFWFRLVKPVSPLSLSMSRGAGPRACVIQPSRSRQAVSAGAAAAARPVGGGEWGIWGWGEGQSALEPRPQAAHRGFLAVPTVLSSRKSANFPYRFPASKTAPVVLAASSWLLCAFPVTLAGFRKGMTVAPVLSPRPGSERSAGPPRYVTSVLLPSSLLPSSPSFLPAEIVTDI